MIISHRYQFIFIHCRKVAGSAVKVALGPILGPDDIMIGSIHEHLRNGGRLNANSLRATVHPGSWKRGLSALLHSGDIPTAVNASVIARYARILPHPVHPSAREIRAAFPTEWSTYFKFCFVRNPFERLVSDYHWRSRSTGISATFTEYLEALDDKGERRGLVHPGPRSNWDMYAIDDEVSVDFIGRYESLEEDFGRVTAYLDLPPVSLRRRVKVGGYSRDLTAYYGPYEQALAARLCAEEVGKFGYSLSFQRDER